MTNSPENATTITANCTSQGRMRMWPSAETASWLYNLANIGLVIGLVLTFVFTILLAWMGNIKEGYLNRDLADSRERTASLEKQSIESKTAIAKANADAAQSLATAKLAEANLAEANSRAEEAQAAAAKANARSDEAKAESAKSFERATEAQRHLAEANVRAAQAEQKAAEANERTQQLNRETALLRKEAAQAKLELEQLKTKTAPRLLTENQKQFIINYLKTARKRPVRVIALSNNQEVMAYAKDILSCLNEAGFIAPTHSTPEQITGLTVHTVDNDSLVVAYHSEAEAHEDFTKEDDYHNILNAFRMLKIPIGTIKSPNIVRPGEIALMVSGR